jgi:16S rRNA (cytosine1402-N4)-methyltransferase
LWDLRKEGPLLLPTRWGDPPDSATFDHVPVLVEPVLAGFAELEGLLDQCSQGVLLDCSFSGGGHSPLLLEDHLLLRLIGLDRDPTAPAVVVFADLI